MLQSQILLLNEILQNTLDAAKVAPVPGFERTPHV